ncbi:uncharacterized protein LOC142334802 isoform X2 [Convolutriloba macropyga]
MALSRCSPKGPERQPTAESSTISSLEKEEEEFMDYFYYFIGLDSLPTKKEEERKMLSKIKWFVWTMYSLDEERVMGDKLDREERRIYGLPLASATPQSSSRDKTTLASYPAFGEMFDYIMGHDSLPSDDETRRRFLEYLKAILMFFMDRRQSSQETTATEDSSEEGTRSHSQLNNYFLPAKTEQKERHVPTLEELFRPKSSVRKTHAQRKARQQPGKRTTSLR